MKLTDILKKEELSISYEVFPPKADTAFESVRTAVDTCGFVPKDAIDKVMPYTDTFLYDIKAFDEDVHIKCTGHMNKPILENLRYIDSRGKAVEIRIPYVPKFNDDQIEKIADFLSTLKNITKIRVLPYHNYAGIQKRRTAAEVLDSILQ